MPHRIGSSMLKAVYKRRSFAKAIMACVHTRRCGSILRVSDRLRFYVLMSPTSQQSFFSALDIFPLIQKFQEAVHAMCLYPVQSREEAFAQQADSAHGEGRGGPPWRTRSLGLLLWRHRGWWWTVKDMWKTCWIGLRLCHRQEPEFATGITKPRPVCAHAWSSRLAQLLPHLELQPQDPQRPIQRDSALNSEDLVICHDQTIIVRPPAVRSSTTRDCIGPLIYNAGLHWTFISTSPQDATTNFRLLFPRAQCSKRSMGLAGHTPHTRLIPSVRIMSTLSIALCGPSMLSTRRSLLPRMRNDQLTRSTQGDEATREGQ